MTGQLLLCLLLPMQTAPQLGGCELTQFPRQIREVRSVRDPLLATLLIESTLYGVDFAQGTDRFNQPGETNRAGLFIAIAFRE